MSCIIFACKQQMTNNVSEIIINGIGATFTMRSEQIIIKEKTNACLLVDFTKFFISGEKIFAVFSAIKY